MEHLIMPGNLRRRRWFCVSARAVQLPFPGGDDKIRPYITYDVQGLHA